VIALFRALQEDAARAGGRVVVLIFSVIGLVRLWELLRQ
jgi:hypothetical protein